MNKLFFILVLLTLSLSSYSEEVPVFLECGGCLKKSCDELGELKGKPNKLIKINDMPKESTNGNSEGKVFGSGRTGYAWKSAQIKYDAKTIYILYIEYPTHKSKTLNTYTIQRAGLKLNKGQTCKLITKEEIEEKANDIIRILMNQNQI